MFEGIEGENFVPLEQVEMQAPAAEFMPNPELINVMSKIIEDAGVQNTITPDAFISFWNPDPKDQALLIKGFSHGVDSLDQGEQAEFMGLKEIGLNLLENLKKAVPEMPM